MRATKRVLAALAATALARAVFLAAVDAFADHLFGDPDPERAAGSGRVVHVSRVDAAAKPQLNGSAGRPLPQCRVA